MELDPGGSVAPVAPVAEAPLEPEDVLAETASAEPSENGAPGEAPKRKRSRRGSRGGKKRRKPSADGTQGPEPAPEAGTEPALAETGVATEAPEYVPMSEWIDDFDGRGGE